jgi:signal transduction histidine kinase
MIVTTLFDELLKLGVDKSIRSGIGIMDKSRRMEVWTASTNPSGNTALDKGILDMGIHQLLIEVQEAWEAKKTTNSYELVGDDLIRYFKAINDAQEYSFQVDFEKLPDKIIHYDFFFPEGALFAFSPTPLSDEISRVFMRFASVFGQTYRRYLDLQKAEAQAREAQIEAALERVRSRSLAMHSSDEFVDASDVMVNQLKELGIDTLRIGIGIINKEDDSTEIWSKSEIEGKVKNTILGVVPRGLHPIFDQTVDAWKKNESFYSSTRIGVEVKEYYQKLDAFLSYPERKEYNERETMTAFFFLHGSLNVISLDPLKEEDRAIMIRFAKVFGQIYQRFRDLQKAEAQAREAQIEAALERVRSRTMAMHKSDELLEIGVLLFQEVSKLGINIFNCGYVLMDDDAKIGWNYGVNPGDGSIRPLPTGIPQSGTKVLEAITESWEKQEPLLLIELDPEETLEHQAYMAENMLNFSLTKEQLLALSPERLVIHTFNFKHGYLLLADGAKLTADKQEMAIRFANVFEQTYTRFLDLQKAEAQTREAQIEAALERVRARTMAMQSSNELRDVALELRKQMGILEISELETCAIHLYEGSEDYFTSWAASKSINNESGYILSEIQFPRIGVSSLEEIIDLYRKKTMDYVVTNDHKRLSEFMVVLKDVMPETYKIVLETFESVPENKIKTFWALADFNGGSLVISTTTMPSNDTRTLLRRFANVFNLSYQRFSDLKQAEAQAREAKIELALERVRAAAMAMHQSDELPDMLSVLFDQFDILGINPSFTHLTLFDEINETFSYRMSGTAGHRVLVEQIHDINRLEAWKIAFEQWKSGDPNTINCIDYPPEVLPMIFDIIEPILSSMPEESRVRIEDFPNGLYTVQGHCKFGYLGFHHHRRATEEEKNIIVRFAGEFGRVYQRFLDLQKAEAQAREAQIEAALERIRSRAMAMQHSEELRDVALELRTQMGILGQKDLEVCTIHLYEEHKNHFESWAAMHLHGKEERLLQFQALFPKSGKLIIDEMMECYASDQNEYVLVNEGEKGRQWFELLREKAPEAFQYLMEATANIPAEQMKAYWGIADFSGGALVMVTYFYPDKDSRDLLRRTANVFALAYKRFQDLRMAESSARAIRRQASLDRIRADISSMRNAEDLNRITPLVFNELTALGIPFIRCGVFIVHEKKKNVEIYLSTPEGKSLAVMTLPFSANEMTSKSVEAWKKEEVYIQHWNQTDFTNWGKSMQEQGYVKDLKTYQGTETAPESLHLHFVPFTQGLLYVGSPENLTEEQIDLVKSMAKAFSIAYARYEDFVKLEQAKAEVESAMSELKATQSQLVQQEKLASLGQLTAGIAHEIKNPLNFVNNFSEVSLELLDEIKETRNKSQETRPKTEEDEIEDEILEDIKGNLKKIHEHGSRANGIVTSMLQHSRGGSGKKEPTDLNALIKEYVNLSFHGMRAGKNPIDVDIVLDLDPEVKEVSLIKEDFTRVVINLCNNAFDACAERSRSAMREKTKMYNVPSLPAGKAGSKYQEGVHSEVKYLPKLKVTTMLENGRVRIAFKDNGPGIPDDIKDKILQPFFTTKKGTEGTGLGLSITHDIIKAHGGELTVDSQKGEMTMFLVQIPIKD